MASQQRHRRCLLSPRVRHATRSQQDAPVRLGEPGSRTRTMEKGRSTCRRQHQNEYVRPLEPERTENLAFDPPHAEKQLLETISLQIQRVKTDNVPHEPYTYPQPVPPPTKPAKTKNTVGKSTAAAHPSKAKSKPHSSQRAGRPLPSPPGPQPALKSRVSSHSPALPSGVLIDTIRAGMNATDGQGAAGGIPGGKGKRKVVRVRG